MNVVTKGAFPACRIAVVWTTGNWQNAHRQGNRKPIWGNFLQHLRQFLDKQMGTM
jgi:hypothetical protein